MNKAILISWLCTMAFGGFLAFSSNLHYILWIFVPALWAVLAYRIMTVQGRKLLILESVMNCGVGFVLGLLFTKSGLMSGVGIFFIVVMLVRMGFRIWKIYKIESCLYSPVP
jgi:hypothetical protein